MKTARGDNPYVGIPVFTSRAFRHTAIYIRTDKGINRPQDLKGRRIGVPEYQLTANVWARAILSDDHGVKPSDITWVRGGLFRNRPCGEGGLEPAERRAAGRRAARQDDFGHAG